jgi:hypothetical protein
MAEKYFEVCGLSGEEFVVWEDRPKANGDIIAVDPLTCGDGVMAKLEGYPYSLKERGYVRVYRDKKPAKAEKEATE